MAEKTDITKDLLERFRAEIVELADKRRNDFPLNQRPGNIQFKKIASQSELLNMVANSLERSRQINLEFLAMAEMIYNKLDKYKIGEKDVLMPIQKKELEWIKSMVYKYKEMEDYK